MNSVSFKSTANIQPQSEKIITPKKEEITEEVDSKKNNAAKLMIGASAAAAIVIGGILVHKGLAAKAAKQAFQEGLNATEHIHIKETPASKNANEMIERVEKLKAQENSAIKNNPYASFDWDAKPISRTQVLFDRKFPTDKSRLAYINPEYEKEFENLKAKGYKINVEDLPDGQKKITYIYPENSPIESKVVTGKIADIEKGYDSSAHDSKWIKIKLKNKTKKYDSYSLNIKNCPSLKSGDTDPFPYHIWSSKENNYSYSNIRSTDINQALDNMNSWMTGSNHPDETTIKCIQDAFKEELNLLK